MRVSAFRNREAAREHSGSASQSVCSPSAQLSRGGYPKYTNGTAVTGHWGSVMYRVLTCLVTEHDWRLVVLAGAICWFASAVAISLFHRARASHGRTRAIWICLDAAVGGCGIWATHFVAMLAYDPGAGAGYSIPVTLLSLLFAVCHCRHRPLRCTVQCAPVGGCDRRCDHRRRRRGDALYRHGGTRASGLHCLGSRYRFGLDRFRKRIRGPCDARRRAP